MLSVFPTDNSVTPTPPFPTHRLCRVGISLLSTGTMKELRLLGSHLEPLDSHSLPNTSADSVYSLAVVSESPHLRLDVVKPVASIIRYIIGGKAELSHLPRESSCAYALTFDSGLVSTPDLLRRGDTVTQYLDTNDPRQFVTFRSSIARLQHSLSTLRAAFADDDARLAYGGRSTFPVWDLHP